MITNTPCLRKPIAAPMRRAVLGAAMALLLGAASDSAAQGQLHVKTIDLGPWNMAATQFRTIDLIPLGISPTSIVGMSAMIRSDAGALYPFSRMPVYNEGRGGTMAVYYDVVASKWVIALNALDFFSWTNKTSFDDPALNRGSITLRYLNTPIPQGIPQDNTLYFRFVWSIQNTISRTVPIPGLPVATGSVVDYQTTIHSNPTNGQVEVDKLIRPSGAQTSYTRDRGGRDEIDASKNLKLFCDNLPSAGSPVTGNGRFVNSQYGGTSNTRGWSMVRYNSSSNASNLSQPFAVFNKVISTGGWDAYHATAPLTLTLSNYGFSADRVLNFQTVAISDLQQLGTRQYIDYHGLPSTGWGGAGITLSGIQNKILFHSNTYSFGSSSTQYSGSSDNRAYMNVQYRAADCADGAGPVLTGSANVGGRTLAAMTWNGSGYVSTTYSGCHGQRNGIYVLENTGNDIWNTTDQFRFAYKTTSGSRPVTVKVEQLENTDAWARAGLMIREGTANNAKYAGIFVTPGNGVIFQARSSTGNNTVDLGRTTGLKAPIWLRLYYSGNSVSAGYSTDGVTFNPLGGAYSISFGTYNMGLAAAGRSNYPNTSVYSNFQ